MTNSPAVNRSAALPTAAVVAAFAMLGLNLRTTFGAVPPLLEDISADLGLSAPAVSLLTAIPIVCLGVLAPPAQRLAQRVGHERLTTWALLLLTVAETLRLAGHVVPLLYLSTLLSGAAMGVVSTLMPGLIGHHLSRTPGLGAGVYSTALATGSAIAAWLAVDLADWLGGWNRSLAAWAVPTAICTLCWILVLPRLLAGERPEHEPEDGDADDTRPPRLPWRSPVGRLISLLFALNTFLGFSILTWLAPAYREAGWSPDGASRLLSVFFAIQVAAMFVLPVITDRTTDRRPLLALSIGSTALGLLGFAALPEWAWVWVTLYGLGLGGGFSLGLVLLVDTTRSRAEAARLSAMVFLLSYTVASLGPIMVGVLRETTGSFTIPFWVLFVFGLLQLSVIPGMRPGRHVLDGVLPER